MLGQRTMRGARVAAPNNLEDYLLAETVDQPPSPCRPPRG
jgi:hypothetical protein